MQRVAALRVEFETMKSREDVAKNWANDKEQGHAKEKGKDKELAALGVKGETMKKKKELLKKLQMQKKCKRSR